MAVAIVVIVAQPKKKKKKKTKSFRVYYSNKFEAQDDRDGDVSFLLPKKKFRPIAISSKYSFPRILSWDGIKNLRGEERKTTKVWKSRKEERKPQRDDPVEESRVDSSAWKKSVFIVFVRLFPPPPSLPFWDHRSFPIFGAFLGKRGL